MISRNGNCAMNTLLSGKLRPRRGLETWHTRTICAIVFHPFDLVFGLHVGLEMVPCSTRRRERAQDIRFAASTRSSCSSDSKRRKKRKPAPMETMNNTAWQRARTQAGLGDLHVHDLRHTVGMRLREAGVREETIADILWHSRRGMTAHYSMARSWKSEMPWN